MVIIEEEYHPIDRELILKRRLAYLEEEVERIKEELAAIQQNK